MGFEGFNFLKKKEVPKEKIPTETPILSEEEQNNEEWKAGFDLRIRMLKRRINDFGITGNGTEESTMAGVEEDLEMLRSIIIASKNDKSLEFSTKLTNALNTINESIKDKPSVEKTKACERVKQFILDILENNLG